MQTTGATTLGVGHILPLEVVDKCIGRQLWVIMKGEKEFYGKLRGFDEYLNMIMDDVKEFAFSGTGRERQLLSRHKNMLLNGAHICMIVPGENSTLEQASSRVEEAKV
jgi:U6 snRNA-associated Sm-like protein LSm5